MVKRWFMATIPTTSTSIFELEKTMPSLNGSFVLGHRELVMISQAENFGITPLEVDKQIRPVHSDNLILTNGKQFIIPSIISCLTEQLWTSMGRVGGFQCLGYLAQIPTLNKL